MSRDDIFDRHKNGNKALSTGCLKMRRLKNLEQFMLYQTAMHL